jgi:hypothetical protein
MRQSLARFSEPESSPQIRPLADFIVTTSEFKFSVQTWCCGVSTGFLLHPSVDRHGIDASRYRSLDRSCVVVNRRAVRVHRIPGQKGWRLGLEASLSVLLVGFSCAELDDHPARKEVSILAGGILHQSNVVYSMMRLKNRVLPTTGVPRIYRYLSCLLV